METARIHATVFNSLVRQYQHIPRLAVIRSMKINGNENVDDYIQEGLIAAWNKFQVVYAKSDGLGPKYPDGTIGTWPRWLWYTIKYGALNYYSRTHLKSAPQVKSFNTISDGFDPVDDLEIFDIERENKLERLEKVIERLPLKSKEYIRAYMNSNQKVMTALRLMSLPHNATTCTDMSWILEVLTHKVKDEADLAFHLKWQSIDFGNALQYIHELRLPCYENPIRRQDFERSCTQLVNVAAATNLSKKQLAKFTLDDSKTLFAEAKKKKYQDGGRTTLNFQNRINNLFSYFHELDLISELLIIKIPRRWPSGDVCGERLKIGTGRHRKTPIEQIDANENVVRVWQSLMEASKHGHRYSSIRRSTIYENYWVDGYLWRYKEEGKVELLAKDAKTETVDFWASAGSLRNVPNNPIDMLDFDGNFIQAFPSITDAVKHIKNTGDFFTSSYIKRVLIGKQSQAHGYKFRWSIKPTSVSA